MAFLAGIDEAGYGPLLGPLTVGFSLFRVPDLEADPWKLLKGTVVKKAPARDTNLRVDDSKKICKGKTGRLKTERAVAAFLGALPSRCGRPPTLREWVLEKPSAASRAWADLPWFGSLRLPLFPNHDPAQIELDAHLIGRACREVGLQPLALGVRAAPATEWNRLTEHHGGKGTALFALTLDCLRVVLREAGRGPLRVWLDRQGARRRYGEGLRRGLAADSVQVLREEPCESLYRVRVDGRTVEIGFQEQADDRQFPVALASMAAKSLRERLMDLWNDWFCEQIPDLKPTRGYASDAKRWLADAVPHLEEIGQTAGSLRRRR